MLNNKTSVGSLAPPCGGKHKRQIRLTQLTRTKLFKSQNHKEAKALKATSLSQQDDQGSAQSLNPHLLLD